MQRQALCCGKCNLGARQLTTHALCLCRQLELEASERARFEAERTEELRLKRERQQRERAEREKAVSAHPRACPLGHTCPVQNLHHGQQTVGQLGVLAPPACSLLSAALRIGPCQVCEAALTPPHSRAACHCRACVCAGP